jgi:hypothetical protein
MATPPSWLGQLAEQVVAQMKAVDILAPVGCHYFHNDVTDQWEVTIFVSATETIGGRFDGKLSASRFHVDIAGLLEVFGNAESVHWQALKLGADDDLGPHLAIEGTYCGNSVWLRVLATAPQQFGAGRFINSGDMRLVEGW